MQRISQVRRLLILRDDHIGDPVGEIFLDPSEHKKERVAELLRSYLGRRVQLCNFVLDSRQIEVEVEVQAMPHEAEQLAAAAQNLGLKGAPRNALELFREALKLDPLSSAAASRLGMLQLELGRYAEALGNLRRARETGPEHAELLFALGRTALMLEREASAIAYLERALELAPSHFGVRRLLTGLGRKPKPSARPQTVSTRAKPAARKAKEP